MIKSATVRPPIATAPRTNAGTGFQVHPSVVERYGDAQTITAYANQCAQLLGLDPSRITVTISDQVRLPDGVRGTTVNEGTGYLILINPRMVNRGGFPSILAHELFHVKQMVNGDLRSVVSGNRVETTWKGREYSSNLSSYGGETEQLTGQGRPWETEKLQVGGKSYNAESFGKYCARTYW